MGRRRPGRQGAAWSRPADGSSRSARRAGPGTPPARRRRADQRGRRVSNRRGRSGPGRAGKPCVAGQAPPRSELCQEQGKVIGARMRAGDSSFCRPDPASGAVYSRGPGSGDHPSSEIVADGDVLVPPQRGARWHALGRPPRNCRENQGMVPTGSACHATPAAWHAGTRLRLQARGSRRGAFATIAADTFTHHPQRTLGPCSDVIS